MLPSETPLQRLRRLTPIACSLQPPVFLFQTADQWIGPSVWQYSAWDEHELSWALTYLKEPQKKGTVLDVGANIGTTTISLVMRHQAERVIAFEPEDRNFRLLRCNLILNGLEQHVTARQMAISDSDQQLTLTLAHENFGDHRITGLWDDDMVSSPETVGVSGRSLDSALSDDELADVSLVWVDTQGHEASVMAGASKLLGNKVPWVIEYWPQRLREANGLEELHQLVAAHFSEVTDLRASMKQGEPITLPADRVAEVGDHLPGEESDLEHFTDLILF